MKKYIYILLTILLFTGCSTAPSYENEAPTKYDAPTGMEVGVMAQSDTTVYFKQGDWIWQYDTADGTCKKLCGLSACTHVGTECNAYYPVSNPLEIEPILQVYDGELYFAADDGDYVLYKMDLEGQQRQRVQKLTSKGAENAASWVVLHRDHVYTIEYEYGNNNYLWVHQQVLGSDDEGDTIFYQSGTQTPQFHLWRGQLYLMVDEGIYACDLDSGKNKQLYRGDKHWLVMDSAVQEGGLVFVQDDKNSDAQRLCRYDFATGKVSIIMENLEQINHNAVSLLGDKLVLYDMFYNDAIEEDRGNITVYDTTGVHLGTNNFSEVIEYLSDWKIQCLGQNREELFFRGMKDDQYILLSWSEEGLKVVKD